MTYVWIWYLTLAASTLSISCYKIAALNQEIKLPISNFYEKHSWHIRLSVIIYIFTFINAFEEIKWYLVFFLGMPLSTFLGMLIIVVFKGKTQLIAPILIFIALGVMIYLHSDILSYEEFIQPQVNH